VILVDTSIWVDHLRAGSRELVRHLDARRVLIHSWVIGELALGNLRRRTQVLALLGGLPHTVVASHEEVMALIDGASLDGSGIGYVDAQLLAATRLTPDASLWTGERRLAAAASRLQIAHSPLTRA
jgi:predicted nucleic acid-binding protein